MNKSHEFTWHHHKMAEAANDTIASAIAHDWVA
jgi:hypothetical protein